MKTTKPTAAELLREFSEAWDADDGSDPASQARVQKVIGKMRRLVNPPQPLEDFPSVTQWTFHSLCRVALFRDATQEELGATFEVSERTIRRWQETDAPIAVKMAMLLVLHQKSSA